MMREPRTDSSESEGTAEINVESRLEPQHAKSSDADEPFRSRRKDQGVCSRLGFYRCQHQTHPILSLEGTHRSRVHNRSQPTP
jgi:hypothetical protein